MKNVKKKVQSLCAVICLAIIAVFSMGANNTAQAYWDYCSCGCNMSWWVDDPVHYHYYGWGPYYESTHHAQGHRTFYYCTDGDGATQLTGNYAPYSGCSICNHTTHDWQNNGEVTEHSNGHKQPQKCSISGCGATRTIDVGWSWQNNGSYSHVNQQHVQPQKCSYCGTPQNVSTPAPTSCTTCYPPAHTCTPGAMIPRLNHPHERERVKCTINPCPNGNYNQTELYGNGPPFTATWSWQDHGNPFAAHTEHGHVQPQECSFFRCYEMNIEYVSLSGCLPCEDPRDYDMLVMLDDSALNAYGSAAGVSSIMGRVSKAFANYWGINLAFGYEDAPAGIPLNGCTRSECNYTCGKNCYATHHNNLYKNIEWMHDNLDSEFKANNGDYDYLFLLTTSNVCGDDTDPAGHTTNIHGLSLRAWACASASTAYLQVGVHAERIIQHELSHLFGAHDSVCASHSCVMYYGSDMLKNDIFNLADIWCDTCEGHMNAYRPYLP